MLRDHGGNFATKAQWLISWNSASNLELSFSTVVGTVINIQERPTSSRNYAARYHTPC
jgi:hypothetical protein